MHVDRTNIRALQSRRNQRMYANAEFQPKGNGKPQAEVALK